MTGGISFQVTWAWSKGKVRVRFVGGKGIPEPLPMLFLDLTTTVPQPPHKHNVLNPDIMLLYPTTTKINPLFDSSAVWGGINSLFFQPWMSTYPSCLILQCVFFFFLTYVVKPTEEKHSLRHNIWRFSIIKFHSYINIGANT